MQVMLRIPLAPGQLGFIQLTFGFPRSSFDRKPASPKKTNTDVFESLFNRLESKNLLLVTAVANDAEGEDGRPPSAIDEFSPHYLCGPATPCVIVGACDRNGNRALYSQWIQNANRTAQPLIDIYTIGHALTAERGTPDQYAMSHGASIATSITTGILSRLTMSNVVTTAMGAKRLLLQVAQQRKGTNWPTEPEGYPIPRAADDWEVTCPPANAMPGGPPVPTSTRVAGSITTTASASIFPYNPAFSQVG